MFNVLCSQKWTRFPRVSSHVGTSRGLSHGGCHIAALWVELIVRKGDFPMGLRLFDKPARVGCARMTRGLDDVAVIFDPADSKNASIGCLNYEEMLAAAFIGANNLILTI